MVTTKKANNLHLLLDLGEVLIPLNFKPLFKAFDLFKNTDGDLSGDALARWGLYDKFERGDLDEQGFRVALAEALGREVPHEQFLSHWNSVFDGHLPEVDEFLKEMSSQMPVFALSNTNPSHMLEVKRLYPWLSSFREVFTSYELKARKPEAEIFQRALTRMNARAEDVIFVDDRKENVESAHKLGINAYVAARSVERLREIVALHRTS